MALRGQGTFRPGEGFGAAYRRFFDLDLGQSFHWFEHDGQRLAAQRFEPTGPVEGSAIVVHGYYDHVGLYGHLIRYLLGRGLRVFAYDQQGHGLSTGRRVTIDSFDRYTDDLGAFAGAHARTLAKPCWLVGQSMGASVILEMLDTRQAGQANAFEHVVLFAPLVRPASWPLSRITYAVGRHVVEEVPRKFAMNAENAEFAALVQADPLQARTLPVEWVTAMIDWKSRFERREPSGRPVFVLQGGRDATVDGRYNVKVLKRRYELTLLAMPEARHHLVNEAPSIRGRMWRFLDGVGT
ncbi:MAG: alpha/beta hydrolase [Gammaproteobacteria bacterium]|nr:alpha/beta hydrolase [Gammaproteobacteria bacterium]